MDRRRAEQPHPIRTIYFGGGTPSLLPINELARIVDGLHRCFDLSQIEEVTIECNPEDLTDEYLSDLANLHFFNRISIGIQSLDDRMLHLLGRRHTAAQAIDSVQTAHEKGFTNTCVDFIYGLPILSGATAALSIPQPLIETITHVSAYALTIEPGTALDIQVKKGLITLPDEDETVRQYLSLKAHLEKNGFRQYEISNYARSGYNAKHNSRYWNRTPYLGLGAAAHSFDGQNRRWNPSDIKRYIDDPLTGYGTERISIVDLCNELIMTSLRTTDGLPLDHLPPRFLDRILSSAKKFVDCGWLSTDGGRLIPTAEGLLHADGMAASLFVD